MAKTPLLFWSAREVKDIARELITDFHPYLADETIVYIFRSEHSEKDGDAVYGTAKKVSGLNAYLAFRSIHGGEEDGPIAPESFYIIDIAHDVWLALTGPQRIALVDHELSHIGADGMRGHDVEEFRGVIERHGLWRPNLVDFIAAAQQEPLFDDKVARLAADSKIRAAVEKMWPKKGSGIDSVSFSTPGHEPVVLTARD